MKSIALVVNSFPKVSETFIYNKALALASENLMVTVICHSQSKDLSFFNDWKSNENIKIIHSPLANRSVLFRLLIFLVNFRIFFKVWNKAEIKGGLVLSLKQSLKFLPFWKKSFDLVHFEFSGLAIQYLDVMSLIPGKKIVSCRGTAELVKPIVDKQRGEDLKQLFKRVDFVHCVSDHMRKHLRSFGLEESKTFVNHPAIDLNYFSRKREMPEVKKETTIKLLSVGRLNWIKGYHYAIEAIHSLKLKGIEITYNIFGRGAENAHLQFLINQRGLEDSVFLKSVAPKELIIEELEGTDIFIQPSLSEGLSNAALEAMAMEVPVISSRVGGMPEAITHGETGILFESGNFNELADLIEDLIQNPEKRQKIGKSARQRVEKDFEISDQISKFLEIYRELFSTGKNQDV